MQVLDGVIFMCASVIYKETKKKNTGILKIVNSQVIDEYFMSNKYYDYIIMKYMDKPYLIIFGSMMQMSGDVISQYNSIKFYRASEFIEKKEERYPVKEIKEIDENYPDLLQREIKLYKKGNSNSNIICETENNKNEGLNKLENCVGLAVDPSLTYAAIALEKGQIVIISAFPNLLDCKGKKMKTTLLTLPEKDGPYLDITNIKFGDLYSEGEKKILYVSTKNYLAYYEWSMDEKVGDNLDMNTKCNFFSNISSGALEGCLCAKRYAMLVASSDEKCIYEFSRFNQTYYNQPKKRSRSVSNQR